VKSRISRRIVEIVVMWAERVVLVAGDACSTYAPGLVGSLDVAGL
jgi:hypothetical protein